MPVQPQPTIPSKRRSISTERPASCSTKSDHPSAKRSSSNSSSRDSRSSKTVSTSKAKDHEKTLEKLKFYISKCGVRKNWKSELDGLPPLKCVEKLKGILADLGMTGRPSLAQCKAIKEKLELQRELDDLISSETERQDKPCASEEDASNDSQGLSDGETPPKKVSTLFYGRICIIIYYRLEKQNKFYTPKFMDFNASLNSSLQVQYCLTWAPPPLGPLCFGEDFFVY